MSVDTERGSEGNPMEKTIELAIWPGEGPVFVRHLKRGDKVEPWEPEVGNTAVVRSLSDPDVRISVRITEAQQRKYKGEIIGFDGWNEREFQTVEPGDSILFVYAHIFTCMR
jgi:hypothetical protein